jgi:hypothetical protein
MAHNMGKTERIVRLILGVALFYIGLGVFGAVGVFSSVVSSMSEFGLAVSLAGVVVFLTGLFSYCPINAVVRHNSCEACELGETHRHMPV